MLTPEDLSTGDYETDCANGREFAVHLATTVADDGNVARVAHIARDIFSLAGFGGFFIGFMTALGEMAAADIRDSVLA